MFSHLISFSHHLFLSPLHCVFKRITPLGHIIYFDMNCFSLISWTGTTQPVLPSLSHSVTLKTFQSLPEYLFFFHLFVLGSHVLVWTLPTIWTLKWENKQKGQGLFCVWLKVACFSVIKKLWLFWQLAGCHLFLSFSNDSGQISPR